MRNNLEGILFSVSASSLEEGEVIRWNNSRFLVEDVAMDGETAVILITDSSHEDSDLAPLELDGCQLVPVVSSPVMAA